MHPYLRRCRDELLETVRDLTVADAEAATDGKWSIAGILEHLDLAYTMNAAGLVRRLEKGTPQAGHANLKQRLARLVIVKAGYFPTGRKAPDAVVPTGRRFAELSAVIGPHLMVLDQQLLEAARVFGARRAVLNHPILGPFSVNDWRRFHWIHTRHHLRQIRDRAKGNGQKEGT